MVLNSLGVSAPEVWTGSAVDNDSGSSYMIQPGSQGLDVIFTGVRTSDRKIIERRDIDDPETIEAVEIYDLETDPDETTPIDSPDDRSKQLRADLHDFLECSRYELSQYGSTGNITPTAEVNRRLSELGYQ